MLSAQPDRSVAISSVGLLTNLAALLRSGPDDNSPLDGRALVAQKVGTVSILSTWVIARNGEVTSEKELFYSSSYIKAKNFETIVTSVNVTTVKIWLKK